MRSRWLLSGTVALTTSLALVAGLPGSARAVGEPSERRCSITVAEARAKALAEDMARTDEAGQGSGRPAEAAKAKVEDRLPRSGSRPSTCAPRGRTAGPAGTGSSEPAPSLARSRAAIPASSCSRSSGQAGRTARRPRSSGATRQTESLLKALKSNGAGKYKLVRTTAYVRAGTEHGTQGARILYDSTRYTLVTTLPGDHRWQQLQRELRHQAAHLVLGQ